MYVHAAAESIVLQALSRSFTLTIHRESCNIAPLKVVRREIDDGLALYGPVVEQRGFDQERGVALLSSRGVHLVRGAQRYPPRAAVAIEGDAVYQPRQCADAAAAEGCGGAQRGQLRHGMLRDICKSASMCTLQECMHVCTAM